ncbi:MAG: OmpA family protein [Methylococcales bacterium]|nr:OmpA family protein [Methylococcales bacterium]
MKKNILLTTTLAAVLVSGCATQAIQSFQAFQPEDLTPQVKSGRLVQKTNSFFVVNDSSSSMGGTYLGSSDYKGAKLDVEKDLLNKINRTIPAIPLSSGLLSFGFGSCLSWGSTLLNQPLQQYSTGGFDAVINSLHCASGGTPLADALSVANDDIKAANGNIALIVLSDGMDDASAVPAAEALKNRYGDRLCIYTVWVGNEADAEGQANLDQIATVGGCGFATDAASLSSTQGAGNFVKKVFFKEGHPAPVTPPPAKPKCSNAPKGAIVDKDGCWSFHGVLFDFDSDKIKSRFHPAIENAVEVLKLNPGLTIEIEGHTDGIGSVAYNLKLSERRAMSIKNELVKQGVDPKRLTTVGYGKSDPVASNDTEEGRAYNRRVVYKRTDQ